MPPGRVPALLGLASSVPVAPRGRLKATCRWGLRVSDLVGGPARLSGDGFRRYRLSRAKAYFQEAASNMAPARVQPSRWAGPLPISRLARMIRVKSPFPFSFSQ